MANQYETYLSRLRSMRQNRPEMKVYERNMQAMSKPFNILNEQTARMTQRGGASTAAQVAALAEGRNQWNQQQQENYGQALNAASQREGQIDMKIAEVESQNAAYKEQQAEIKRQKQQSTLRSALQIGGTVLGAALAIPTGGMSMLAGAALGGAIGQTASGFVGVDRNGNLSVQPDDWDMDVAAQGLASTISAVSHQANQKKTEEMMSILSENAGDIFNHIANSDSPEAARFMLGQFLRDGSVEQLQNFVAGMKQGKASASLPGNIDLSSLPTVQNEDGSVSTVRTITVGYDDGVYVLPTIVDGREVSEDEAVANFERTRRHLGRYATEEEALAASQRIHEMEEQRVSASQPSMSGGVKSVAPSTEMPGTTVNPQIPALKAGGQDLTVPSGSYRVERGGTFSRGNGGHLVTRVNGNWVKVRDANGNPIPISVGETIQLFPDGTFQIGG